MSQMTMLHAVFEEAAPAVDAVVELVEGARRTVRTIQRGVVFSLAYNVFAAGLAMAGLIHPLVAAVLMPASSLTVVLIAWRSRTFDLPAG